MVESSQRALEFSKPKAPHWRLCPDRPLASLIHKVTVKEGPVPFAQVVLRDREQIVLLRPVGKSWR
jgi:hypothetical protein